jgi:hypothetical protein
VAPWLSDDERVDGKHPGVASLLDRNGCMMRTPGGGKGHSD